MQRIMVRQVGHKLRIGGWVKTGREAGGGDFAFLEVNDGSTFSNLQARAQFRRVWQRSEHLSDRGRRPEAPTVLGGRQEIGQQHTLRCGCAGIDTLAQSCQDSAFPTARHSRNRADAPLLEWPEKIMHCRRQTVVVVRKTN